MVSRGKTSEPSDKDKLLATAIERLELLRKAEAFDPNDSNSRPTKDQQTVLDDFGVVRHQYVRAGNQSGKSSTAARIASWVLQENHPKWTRPAHWGTEGLLLVVGARTGKQIEESLWPRIRGFLTPGSYKEIRGGNILQRVEMKNGNRLVFQSLENPNTARERLQSYTAHMAWVDELPPTLGIISELHRAVQAKNGYFIATFTPLTPNLEVQRFIDGISAPLSKLYSFRMLDNPVYADPERQREILETLSHLPEQLRNARLYGDWMTGDSQVYHFDYESMVEMPEGYSPMWRHVEVVDPALKSALGLIITAEDPETGLWYMVHAQKIKGIYVPTQMVETVRAITKNYNIIRRISDPHEVWYIQQAAAAGIQYMGVYKKNDRKAELIKGLQEALGSKLRIAPHCADFLQEIQDCRWSDAGEGKIINSSSFHLLDCAQYFCDNIPKRELGLVRQEYYSKLYSDNEKRKQNKQKAIETLEKKAEIKRIRRTRKGQMRWGQRH